MELRVVKRRCSECGKEVEYESDCRYRTDLFFCSEECDKKFWKRDAERRVELGWPPLKDEDGNIAFPLEGDKSMVLEIELPEACECGQLNLKIWGTRIMGLLKIEVRCSQCGKVLWKKEVESI